MNLCECDHCRTQAPQDEVAGWFRLIEPAAPEDTPRTWLSLGMTMPGIYRDLCSWECVQAFAQLKQLDPEEAS